MSEGKRYYRKKLTSQGRIFIAGEEIEISVRNLSITGLLAELAENSIIQDIHDLFDAIKKSTKVDIYLEEMRLMGEAEVVRADLVDGQIYLALEFKNITYDVDSTLYKRHAYRKEMIAPGLIVFHGRKYQFMTRNVSIHGLMIYIEQKVEVAENTVTIFDFKRLGLRGEIRVVWVEPAQDGGTYMGLEYVNMEKEKVKGIPAFEPRELF